MNIKMAGMLLVLSIATIQGMQVPITDSIISHYIVEFHAKVQHGNHFALNGILQEIKRHKLSPVDFVNEYSTSGATALGLAMYADKLDNLKWLLRHEADANKNFQFFDQKQQKYIGYTPIQFAIVSFDTRYQNKVLAFVEQLLKHGARVHSADIKDAHKKGFDRVEQQLRNAYDKQKRERERVQAKESKSDQKAAAQ